MGHSLRDQAMSSSVQTKRWSGHVINSECTILCIFIEISCKKTKTSSTGTAKSKYTDLPQIQMIWFSSYPNASARGARPFADAAGGENITS